MKADQKKIIIIFVLFVIAISLIPSITATRTIGIGPSIIEFSDTYRFGEYQRTIFIYNGNDYESNLGFSESLFHLFKTTVKDTYGLKFLSSAYAPVLSDLAQIHEFDIFFPYVNNIFFPSDNMPPMKRIEKTLQFIARFRKTYEKPIIATYGYPNDPSFSDKLKEVGADFAIRAPFEVKDILVPIEKCLNEIA